MLGTCLPVGIRMYETGLVLTKVVMMMTAAALMTILIRNRTSVQNRSGLYKICTCTIQCYRVKRSSDAEVRNDGCIIMVPAVTVIRIRIPSIFMLLVRDWL